MLKLSSTTANTGLTIGGDTNLYRSAPDTLKTDDNFITVGSLYVDNSDLGQKLFFGSAADTNLYRSTTSTLKTDNNLIVGANLTLQGSTSTMNFNNENNSSNAILASNQAGDAASRFVAQASGQLNWGGGTTGTDTNLYRGGTGLLLTDGKFQAGGNVIVGSGSVSGYGGGSIAFNNIGGGQLPGAVSGGGTLFVNSGTLQYRGAGNIASISSDFSEEMPVENNVQPEDVVSLSDNATADANVSLTGYVLQKSQTPYDSKIMGVVSALAGSQHSPGTQSITFTGRVPVKVTGEGGAIAAGDNLTSSSTPGYAMKMTHAGQSIGKALSDFGGSSSGDQGSVIVSANTSYYNPQPNLQGGNDVLTSLMVSGQITTLNLTVNGDAQFKGNITVAGDIQTAASRHGANVSINQGDTQAVVNLTAAQVDRNYTLQITPGWVTAYGVINKTATGFTVEFDKPAPLNATFDWLIIR